VETVYFYMTVGPAVLLTLLLIIGDFDIEFDLDSHDFSVGDSHGVGPLSLKLMLAFTAGYGLGGYLAYKLEWSLNHAVSGLLFAVPIYLLVFVFMRFLYSQRANTQVSSKNIVGQKARVTAKVLSDGVGEIVVEDPKVSRTLHMPARTDSGTDIDVDSIVLVESVDVGTARVKRL